jgi:hypothetical protein
MSRLHVSRSIALPVSACLQSDYRFVVRPCLLTRV